MTNDDIDSPADEISLLVAHDQSQRNQSLGTKNESNATHISETNFATQLAQFGQEELGDGKVTDNTAMVSEIATEPHDHAGPGPLKTKFFVRPVNLEGPSTPAFFAFRQAPRPVMNMAINAGGQRSFGPIQGEWFHWICFLLLTW